MGNGLDYKFIQGIQEYQPPLIRGGFLFIFVKNIYL